MQLGIGQPLLSKRIAQTEQALGVRLFYRNRRNVKLSEAGELLLPEAQGLLNQAAQFVDLAAQAAHGEAGVVRVGYERTSILSHLPAIVRRYRQAYPNVVLRLEELHSNHQLPLLVKRELDAGFLHPPTYDETLELFTLTSEPLMVALPLDHSLAGSALVQLADLTGEFWLAYPRELGPDYAVRVDNLFRKAGLTQPVTKEVASLDTRLGLVAAGEGICLAKASVKPIEPPGVVILPLEPTVNLDLAVAWRRHNPSAALRTFLEVVRSFYNEQAESRDSHP